MNSKRALGNRYYLRKEHADSAHKESKAGGPARQSDQPLQRLSLSFSCNPGRTQKHKHHRGRFGGCNQQGLRHRYGANIVPDHAAA